MSYFKDVPAKVNFVEQEKQILKFWKESRAFQKMRELHQGQPRWSFIDGPITANNPMGVHHAWGRTYKDLFNRYMTMRGHELRYQNGFDCQGLWVEVNVEKDLGFKTKKDIEAYGLAPFVVLCKQRVLHHAAVQTEQSVRLGMWMDWDDPETLRFLRDKLGADPNAMISITAPSGRELRGTVEQVVGQLGLPQFGGSYFTFSDENNYDIWLMLKKCSDNKWIYKGTDVMPWCWRCGTGISQHEIVTEGYIEKSDPGLTVRFPLVGRDKESLLVWTTTPWTLTSNVAAAVGPDLTYVQVKQGDETLYLSKGTTKMLKGVYEVVRELQGREMDGWAYAGPFDDLPSSREKGGWSEPMMRRLFAQIAESAVEAHRIVLWNEVTEAEGTGVVHIAPGCGEEDFQLHKQYNLPVIAPLDESGNYIEGMGWLSGKHVSEVTDAIVEDLKKKNLFYRLEKFSHRYPECWRCHTPLVFRLVDEWFISMDGIREPVMRITEQIRWIPEYGRDRELDWLRNMHDWMISKKRYWGLALPIWECDHCGHFDVLGSRDELEERAVEGWDEFKGHTPHRPYIDAVKIKCSNCGEKTARIKDVGNPWLDAGIVSFSTMGYKTDRAYWQKWFPGDFITESFPGQFRNWFYSLLTMAAVLENQPASKIILGYQTLLAEEGDAMHKSAGNMIEFNEAADAIGSDVMRWMYAQQNYDTNILFGYKHADQVRRLFMLPLWNVYSFFVTYAKLDNWRPNPRSPFPTREGGRGDRSDLDRWILARLQQTIDEATAALDDYHIYTATKPIEEFLDDLSNWYVRRSRRRFWKTQTDSDKQAAYETLYEVLVTLCKLLAPFVPFVTEAMYQSLVRVVDANAPESVHHCDWPKSDIKKLNQDLLADMGAARRVVALGHGVRGAANLKVRQPLARALVVVPPEQRERVKRMQNLITDELNVKEMELVADEAQLVTYNLLPDNRLLGPKFGARFPRVRAALAATDPARAVATLRSGRSVLLKVDGERVELAPHEVLVTPQPKAGFAVQAEDNYVVALDTKLTDELRLEGLAREFVRHVQDLRKSAGFEIEDRIVTHYVASENLARAISRFGEYVRGETLSVELEPGSPPAGASIVQDDFDGEKVALGIAKVKFAKSAKKVKNAKAKAKSRKPKAKTAKRTKIVKGGTRTSRKNAKR